MNQRRELPKGGFKPVGLFKQPLDTDLKFLKIGKHEIGINPIGTLVLGTPESHRVPVVAEEVHRVANALQIPEAEKQAIKQTVSPGAALTFLAPRIRELYRQKFGEPQR